MACAAIPKCGCGRRAVFYCEDCEQFFCGNPACSSFIQGHRAAYVQRQAWSLLILEKKKEKSNGRVEGYRDN